MASRTEQPGRFQGFSNKAFGFLKDLKKHNDKQWFNARRGDYEQYLLGPLRDLVTNLVQPQELLSLLQTQE